MQKLERSLGTHNGPFHADEVTACALLLYCDCIDLDKIVRTRDPNKLAQCHFVCDVGGVYDVEALRFDHHQREYTGSKSSAGLVLDYLTQENILSSDFAAYLDREWVKGVDAHDNGKELYERGVLAFSHIIALRVPGRNSAATAEQMDAAFLEAVQFTYALILRMEEQFLEQQSTRAIVKEVMDASLNTDSRLLVFDKNITWVESFFALDGKNHPALFLLMPADKHWKLRAVPPSLERRMEMRCRLPLQWRGLQDAELEKMSGIKGAIFCHKGGFVSVWETKEAAMQAYQKVITENN